MSVVVRRFRADPDRVFRVLANGWLYCGWVVGASRCRAVDDGFPEAGTAIHHSFGAWPLVVNDTTTVEVWDPPHRVQMVARGRPIGAARVEVRVAARGDGSVVRIEENAVAGPGALVPRAITDLLLEVRNRESLRRLEWLALGEAAGPARE